MSPEQERNHWILAGYPLMPEWIELCRVYLRAVSDRGDANNLREAQARIMQWVALCDASSHGLAGRFTAGMSNEINYDTGTGVVYLWNLGEDHAVKP